MNKIPQVLLDKTLPEPMSGCWLAHNASYTKQGYSKVWYEGKMRSFHRLMFELSMGPIPPGLEIDHLCFVRCCVNPQHLECVTPSVNTKRMWDRKISSHKKDFCRNGHRYSDDPKIYRGARVCKKCVKIRSSRN